MIGKTLSFLVCIIGLSPATLHGAPPDNSGFEFPPDKTERIAFHINKSAKALRGKVTKKELEQATSDQEVWKRLGSTESKLAPKAKDIVLYPGCGVDFGLPINALPSAGWYVGVDIHSNFSNAEVRMFANDRKFNAAEYFSQANYVPTIPNMADSSAGEGPQFAKSFLRNLVMSLPEDAVVEDLTFIIDKESLIFGGERRTIGPHLVVRWRYQGQEHRALLVSAPMMTSEQSGGHWLFEELDKRKPSYAVMKRPNFDVSKVYSKMVDWVGRKGGIIIKESDDANIVLDENESWHKRLREFDTSAHAVTGKDLNREDFRFGFSHEAVFLEVFPRKSPTKALPNKKHSPS